MARTIRGSSVALAVLLVVAGVAGVGAGVGAGVVAGVAGVGAGAAAAQEAAARADTAPPSAPVDVAATSGDGAVDLTWSAPADDGGSAIVDYRVRYRARIRPRSADPIGPRIVGGQRISVHQAPWQVALLRASCADSAQAQFCGGTLIHREFILTAAHCVTGRGVWGEPVARPSQIEIAAGRTWLGRITENDRVDVAEVIVHPDWNARTFANDVALLRLEEPVARGRLIRLHQGQRPEPGSRALISGWGSTVQQDPDFDAEVFYPRQLRAAEVAVVAPRRCASAYADDGGIESDAMLCASVNGQIDTCQGDSGGSLVLDVDGSWELAGITSFGTGCAWRGYPGVYTRVATFGSWITGHVPDLDWRSTVVEAPPVTVGGLTSAMAYEFVVRARNEAGPGPRSRTTVRMR